MDLEPLGLERSCLRGFGVSARMARTGRPGRDVGDREARCLPGSAPARTPGGVRGEPGGSVGRGKLVRHQRLRHLPGLTCCLPRLIKQPARPGAGFPALREDRPSQEASPTQKQRTARELRVELQEDSNKGLGESGACEQGSLILSPGVHVVLGSAPENRAQADGASVSTSGPLASLAASMPHLARAILPSRTPAPAPYHLLLQPAGCRVQSRRASGSALTAALPSGYLGGCAPVYVRGPWRLSQRRLHGSEHPSWAALRALPLGLA